MEKLKVVWLCHFSNREVQAILRPTHPVGEMAPWITLLAEMCEARSDLEVHIVAPHVYIGRDRHFTLRGIHYHIFRAAYPFCSLPVPYFDTALFVFNWITDYACIKAKVRRLVLAIDPDIVHLHGAENTYYASTALQFRRKYPVLVTIQGFISHSPGRDWVTRHRTRYERRILQTLSHVGYRSDTMAVDIRAINPRACLHWHYYPYRATAPFDVPKEFDIVFFARITKTKGIEDLLQALVLVRRRRPEIRVCIIGACGHRYLHAVTQVFAELQDNLVWAGFLPTQNEVHRLASAARLCVLPTYFDTIPGTIIESLFLKLPVVAYDVGSIHEINARDEVVRLVPKGDIPGLADAILDLLTDDERLREMAEKGSARAHEMFDGRTIVADIRRAYEGTIAAFRSGRGRPANGRCNRV